MKEIIIGATVKFNYSGGRVVSESQEIVPEALYIILEHSINNNYRHVYRLKHISKEEYIQVVMRDDSIYKYSEYWEYVNASDNYLIF
jgi:hypothetical protein